MQSRRLWSAVLAATLLLAPAVPALAEAKSVSPASQAISSDIRILGAEPNSRPVQELMASFNDLVRASNAHSIGDILKHYNPKFISGDNLNLEQTRKLILETWEAYPDIRYESRPTEIRINGDWATIETVDHANATAPPDKEVINTTGHLTSDSRSTQYFRRLGTTWEIMSDSTTWEQAIIRYGIGSDVEITLSAPEQVKAGERYSATIQAKVPDGTFTIATIDNQALTFPHEKVDDKFRALDGDGSALQRVLTANSTNHNEIVTATLGLTTVNQKQPDRPSLSLNGVATIVKRVNVVPISAEDMLQALQQKEVVKTTAAGNLPNKSTGAPQQNMPSVNQLINPNANDEPGNNDDDE